MSFFNNQTVHILSNGAGHTTLANLIPSPKYEPEIGLRTAIVLASILFLIVLFLLWRSRCKCAGNTDDSEDGFDLDYWLRHVDQQKLMQKNYYHQLYNPKLPDAATNSTQTTAEWILKHRQQWLRDLTYKHDCVNITSTSIKNASTASNAVANAIYRLKNRYFPLSKSRKMKRRKQLNFSEYDFKMQLLINYDTVKTRKRSAANRGANTVDSVKYKKNRNTSPLSIYMNSAAVTSKHQCPQRILIRRSHSWPRTSNDHFFLNYRIARMMTVQRKPDSANKQYSSNSSQIKVSPSGSSSLASYRQSLV